MKYLLDTHVVLWVAENSSLLSDKARKAVLNVNAKKYVSIASAWEVAIKIGTQKLHVDGGLPEFFKMIDGNGFFTLPVEREYLLRLPTLPDYHKDPFDRLLLATAIAEGMALVTSDENIRKYGVPCVW
ncbi:MAG: type II toxin-antitoxin system VapC family toxin [Kiritimatiellaeota bacterium]|nr:type II toxin-antitoxin system VapC family toxin [Kiritimatiellota bacterium]